eukprot:scaffold1087_cov198-Pinguiococcus_pyrenoidosus.AAC.29
MGARRCMRVSVPSFSTALIAMREKSTVTIVLSCSRACTTRSSPSRYALNVPSDGCAIRITKSPRICTPRPSCTTNGSSRAVGTAASTAHTGRDEEYR